MKLGFVSAILADFTFEEMIDCASEMGYQCVEVACWPQGKAERRYAAVSHINVDELSDEKGRLSSGVLPGEKCGDLISGLLSQYSGPGSGQTGRRGGASEEADSGF